jgi:RND family efflux transporter MFP subunit
MYLPHLPRNAVLLASALLTACTKSAPVDPRTQTALVQAATVQRNTASQQRFTGVISAYVQSDLGFRVAGKITERLVNAGQHVKRGDALMQLDPTDFSLGVVAQQGSVEAARALSVKADADLARLDGLVQQGAVSAQDFDQAVEAARSAKAQLNAATAQTNISKNANQYAILRADADGVVVSRIADVGQVVSAGQTVVVLAKDGPREAEVMLPETVQPELGAGARAFLYGDEGEASTAKLRELSHSADPSTRTFAARYVLSGTAAHAPLGATVTVLLDPSTTQRGELSVPIGALYDRGRGPGVWLLNETGDHVTYRAVKVSDLSAESASISSGLAPGDRIVALGARELHDDQRVHVVSDKATMQ